MLFLRPLLLITLLTLTDAGLASAVPINFQLDSVTSVGADFPARQTFFPGLPVVGSGDIDFGAGTGTLTLPGHFIFIDLFANGENDSRLAINFWTQNITSIDASGNVTSTGLGLVSCLILGGFGELVCNATPTTVAGWPPPDSPLGMSSAVIDRSARTITVVDNSLAAAGTTTSLYSYSIVPEPGTATLASLGLAGLAMLRRGARARPRL